MWPFRTRLKSGDPGTRIKELANLDPSRPADARLIEEAALHDEVFEVRQVAFKLLKRKNCTEALADRAKNLKDPEARIHVISMVDDQDTLTEIARHDQIPEVRIAAIRKLDNDHELKNIAMTDPDGRVQKEAVRVIVNQHLLAEIAKSCPTEDICLAAVWELTDQNLLWDIILKTTFPQVSWFALEKFSDEQFMAEFLKRCPADDGASGTPEVHLFWQQKLTEKINKQEILMDAALHASDVSIRMLAASKINDEDYLEEIIDRTRDASVYQSALERIEDTGLLYDIINRHGKAGLGFGLLPAAVQKITSVSHLEEMARSDLDETLHDAACKKLRALNAG